MKQHLDYDTDIRQLQKSPRNFVPYIGCPFYPREFALIFTTGTRESVFCIGLFYLSVSVISEFYCINFSNFLEYNTESSRTDEYNPQYTSESSPTYQSAVGTLRRIYANSGDVIHISTGQCSEEVGLYVLVTEKEFVRR